VRTKTTPTTHNNFGGETVKPARKRAAIRYSARTVTRSGIVEITIGANLEKLLARARSHHRRYGQPLWVWCLRDGRTVFEIGGRPLSPLRAVLLAAPS
jgi:hypothetical protein